MRVYTVQHLEAYKKLREQGFLEGREAFVDKDFLKAYHWMKQQMIKRIPNYKGENYPIWLWKRSVNRNERVLLPKGTRGVILTLEIPDDQILWSDFQSWHFVLNNSPITDSEDEWERYLKDEENYEVVKSWDKIFDFDYFRQGDKNWHGTFNEEWIQGVTPRITVDQVKKVTRFIAK
ncbi:hypothetical protein MTP04_21800 [Lysinibacillus sp. PLM2]|nr:hypothetical protein MTP04_21800 [Lysinibacillus sp. PLM2]